MENEGYLMETFHQKIFCYLCPPLLIQYHQHHLQSTELPSYCHMKSIVHTMPDKRKSMLSKFSYCWKSCCLVVDVDSSDSESVTSCNIAALCLVRTGGWRCWQWWTLHHSVLSVGEGYTLCVQSVPLTLSYSTSTPHHLILL